MAVDMNICLMQTVLLCIMQEMMALTQRLRLLVRDDGTILAARADSKTVQRLYGVTAAQLAAKNVEVLLDVFESSGSRSQTPTLLAGTRCCSYGAGAIRTGHTYAWCQPDMSASAGSQDDGYTPAPAAPSGVTEQLRRFALHSASAAGTGNGPASFCVAWRAPPKEATGDQVGRPKGTLHAGLAFLCRNIQSSSKGDWLFLGSSRLVSSPDFAAISWLLLALKPECGWYMLWPGLD